MVSKVWYLKYGIENMVSKNMVSKIWYQKYGIKNMVSKMGNNVKNRIIIIIHKQTKLYYIIYIKYNFIYLPT
jgi:hypothetical protein